MGQYTNVESKFIKEKIKNTKWDDSGYIDNLIFLEKTIIEGVHSMGGNYMYRDLQNKYPKEYEAIYKELKPKEWKKLQEEEKKDKEKAKREQKKEEEEEELEEEEDRKDWVKAKGKK